MARLLSLHARAAVIGLLVSSAGCAPIVDRIPLGYAQLMGRMPLSEANRAQVRSPRTIVVMSGRMIGVSTVACAQPDPKAPAGSRIPPPPASGGLGGWLIDAAVERQCEEARLKAAESEAWPVRDALLGYDLGAALRGALAQELAPVQWLRGNAMEVHQLDEVETLGGAITLARARGADTVLVVDFDYRLSSIADALLLKAEVTMLVTPAPSAALIVAYQNVFHRVERLPAGAGERWGDGEKAQTALVGGLLDVARMIAFDLQEGPTPYGSSPPGSREVGLQGRAITTERQFGAVDWSVAPLRSLFDTPAQVQRGYVVHEGEGRRWVRLLSSGALVSLP